MLEKFGLLSALDVFLSLGEDGLTVGPSQLNRFKSRKRFCEGISHLSPCLSLSVLGVKKKSEVPRVMGRQYLEKVQAQDGMLQARDER